MIQNKLTSAIAPIYPQSPSFTPPTIRGLLLEKIEDKSDIIDLLGEASSEGSASLKGFPTYILYIYIK